MARGFVKDPPLKTPPIPTLSMRPANFWHRANFNTKELLQTESDLHREPFTKRICYTETAFTQSTLLHRTVFAQKYRILKHYLKVFLKGKSSAPKWKKSAAQASFATFMQPLQCNLDFQQQTMGFTRAAAAARNLNAAIPLRSADTELQSTKRNTHNGYTNCSSKNRISTDQKPLCIHGVTIGEKG